MKILHLADLHLGKKLNDFSLILDQRYVLKQVLELISAKNISSVLISGDIFDRAVAPSDALELFGEFLYKLNSLKVKCYIIAGNHDNIERLSYLSNLVENSNIFISKNFSGKVQKYSVSQEIDVYLMPYLYPQIVRKYYPDIKISDYNDAISKVVDDIRVDTSKVNIMVAHQFVSSCDLIYSDSEQKSVGGVDVISPEIFRKFDYTALGHLHCPQKVVYDNIRYSGSILKYSLSEINQKKFFTILNISNGRIDFEYCEINFLHELREYRGYLNDFLDEKFYSKIKVDDFIHFILLDENALDAKKKLSAIYPNIIFLEFDNSFTRNIDSAFELEVSPDKTLFEHFSDFYEMQCGEKMSKDKENIVVELVDKIKEQD